LSCAGNPNDIKKTFKIACLSYIPQPIKYRDRRVERGHLLSLLNDLATEANKIKNCSLLSEERQERHETIMVKVVEKAQDQKFKYFQKKTLREDLKSRRSVVVTNYLHNLINAHTP